VRGRTASRHLLDTDRVRLTREYWTDTGRRALQTAGSAVIGTTVVSLPYSQIVTVGRAIVVAGIAAGLSLLTSLALVGAQAPTGCPRRSSTCGQPSPPWSTLPGPVPICPSTRC